MWKLHLHYRDLIQGISTWLINLNSWSTQVNATVKLGFEPRTYLKLELFIIHTPCALHDISCAGHSHTTLVICISVVTPAVQNTYKPCRSRKYIWGHVPMHAIFAVFISFSYLFCLGHLSLSGPQTKTEDRETLLLSSGSSPIAWRRS